MGSLSKYMLDLKEASAFYGIGIKRCRRIAESGNHVFSVYCGNRWMIHRTKFEEYKQYSYQNRGFIRKGAWGYASHDACGACWKIVSHKYICLAFIWVCVGSPNKLNPQNHLFFGQFSLSIDIYVQTYFNIYFVLALASLADMPCYPPNLFQGLAGFFTGCPA